jgi:GNAT superfamily N-acetyltransferase
MCLGLIASRPPQSPAMVPTQMPAAEITIEDAGPADAAGARLLSAMEDEVSELYRDRDGSIHAVSASLREMGPPAGAFLLVRAGAEPIGCGGLKRLDDETCEIKRMYLEPAWRGRGLSRGLLEALEKRARELGYTRARLDTGDRQPSARRLYETAGYREIPDYNANPLARLWFERELSGELAIRREYREGDRDAIVDLHRRVYPEFGVDESFVRDIAITLDELAARGWPGAGERAWLVERDDEVAGSLVLSDEGGGEGRVRLFLLAPELRGRGIGRRLLGELLDLAGEAAYERLTLATFSDLRAAAHLYRDAGFRVVREDHSPRWGRAEFNYQHYELKL